MLNDTVTRAKNLEAFREDPYFEQEHGRLTSQAEDLKSRIRDLKPLHARVTECQGWVIRKYKKTIDEISRLPLEQNNFSDHEKV